MSTHQTQGADDLERLLEPARQALSDEAVIGRSVRLARARTLSGAPRRRSKVVLAPMRALVFASALAALVLVSAYFVRTSLRDRSAEPVRPAAIAFSVAGVPGIVGERMVAVAPRSLDFDDGTRVELEARGALRVLGLDERGGRLLVEQGTIHASFRHRERTRWTVEAGGMVVEVTGTRFDVTFDPTTQAFELVMREGSVRIRGCGVEAGRVVQGVESVRVSCAATEAKSPAAVPAFTPADLPSAAPAPAIAPLMHEDSSPELLARADAARRAGDVTAARSTLLELRRRFPRGIGAAQAAFDLGVLAFDNDGHYADAARWFQRYLDEAPRGPLAREALGRLMEAQSANGNAEAAAGTAARYSVSYPGGPHASLAKRLVAPRP